MWESVGVLECHCAKCCCLLPSVPPLCLHKMSSTLLCPLEFCSLKPDSPSPPFLPLRWCKWFCWFFSVLKRAVTHSVKSLVLLKALSFWNYHRLNLTYSTSLFAKVSLGIYDELKRALKSEFYSFSFAFKKEKSHFWFFAIIPQRLQWICWHGKLKDSVAKAFSACWQEVSD